MLSPAVEVSVMYEALNSGLWRRAARQSGLRCWRPPLHTQPGGPSLPTDEAGDQRGCPRCCFAAYYGEHNLGDGRLLEALC